MFVLFREGRCDDSGMQVNGAVDLVSHDSQLVVDCVTNRQPVELAQQRVCVAPLQCSHNNPLITAMSLGCRRLKITTGPDSGVGTATSRLEMQVWSTSKHLDNSDN